MTSRSDRHRLEVKMRGHVVEDLTRKEFELLATLVGTPGRVYGGSCASCPRCAVENVGRPRHSARSDRP